MEHSTDRQAAEAVCSRSDWKDVLSLELSDPGFDASVLWECRDRIMAGGKEEIVLSTLLEQCREHGRLQARGKQRTDSTHGDRRLFARSTAWSVWEQRCEPL